MLLIMKKSQAKSWVMRDLWQTTSNITQRHGPGIAAYPKQLKSTGVKSLMERAIKSRDSKDPKRRFKS